MTNVLFVNRSAFCTKSMPLKGDTDTEFVRSSAYPHSPRHLTGFPTLSFGTFAGDQREDLTRFSQTNTATLQVRGAKCHPQGNGLRRSRSGQTTIDPADFENLEGKQCGFSLGHLAVRPWIEEGRRAGQTAQPPHVCRRESYHHAGARPTSLTRPHAPGCGHSDTDGRR